MARTNVKGVREMTLISFHGNDTGSIAGGVLTAALCSMLVLGTFSLYSLSLSLYAKQYEQRFVEKIEKTNREVRNVYEID